uniref:DUF6048 family protein n=1 Tax=Roseihalotalea indica TaxID=2867963 RepID=A0AA49GSI3_9BACT|nr:DUF6048 family protein [Tunicatimonas sp. TK19036]
MRKLLLSSVIIWLSGITLLHAQVVDSLDEVGKYEPLALRVGVSLNNIIENLSRSNDTKYGFQADAVFGRYMLAAEYGKAEITRTTDPLGTNQIPYQYSSQGWFFRVGPDVNLLVNQAKTSFRADTDIIFFGLRLGHARVTDAMTLQTQDDTFSSNGNNNGFWESQTITVQNKGLGVTWVEMTAGMKVQLYRNIFMGYNLRYKFGRTFNQKQSLIPYMVPGFGKGENKNSFGFDYYLFYRIPFRK